MIFVKLKVDNFWTTLSHTLIIFLLSLSSFHFIVLVTKEKESCLKKLPILNVQITLLIQKCGNHETLLNYHQLLPHVW
jgi:hypothetical protein